ncbi:MAG TPA: beta-ketoacyl synthase N-terminal-like domain-containing protein, partial [Longimicrobiales bacterium]|nr:beta-ketoacyl synthase N-terminal-like domain-containing protein [Longimicrobiales bacterium]
MSQPDREGQTSPLKRALVAIEKLQARLDAVERAKREPIAIVGMSCRFPGGANSPEAFWALLREGRDVVREVPPDRWDIDAYYDPDPDAPGKMASRWGAFLDDVAHFDAGLFGITPRECEGLDPQQRLLLELAWEAFEDAGIAPDGLSGSRTGVFVGIANTDYKQLALANGHLDWLGAYYGSGTAPSMGSGRLSYFFGLQGPSISVDTACSSSLVAVHLAVKALRAGECRMALAGGVNLMLAPETTIALSKYRMLAPDGRCKTFDAGANGFVRGEGGALVVLKRLSDAVADGDRILAVIRGSAVNQDGPSSGLTAPNGPSQEAVIREALADGGVEPHEVAYVEAHGTGTSLGDPIEVQALGAVLGEGRPKERPVLIGSVKTNMGHLESAAGIAGLVKAVLAVRYGEIPAHLHFREPNPYIPWERLPVRVVTERERWPEGAERIAGVSSFGFSGTNAHVVVAAAPAAEPGERSGGEVDRPVHVLVVSGREERALREYAGRYAERLGEGEEELSLADVAHTANTGRAQFGHRAAVVAETVEEA